MKLSDFLEEEKFFLEDLKKVDTEKNWERFVQSLTNKQTKTQGFRFRNRFGVFLRIAAAIILLLAVSATLYFTATEPAHRITRATTGSQQMELVLSDGTSVTLNKGTILTFPEKLKRRKREVNLEGEAYFQVKRAEKSPFYINIGEMTAKVVGTSFNLKEDEKGRIELGVVQGSVLFYKKGEEGEPIRLAGGQKGIYDPDTDEIIKEEAPSGNYLFWKTQKLKYRDESLASVFNELELLFNQAIIISDPLILQHRWNSTHVDQKFSEILDVICLTFELEYYQKEDTVYIKKK